MVPDALVEQACERVSQRVRQVPFTYRGIKITRDLIEAVIGILSAEPTKTLPQNSRNAVMDKTPDGLDRRIKERLKSNLRTANIISDVLAMAGIVKVVNVVNPQIGRTVKGTRLLDDWTYKA